MSKIHEFLVLSVHSWLESLLLSSWALQSGEKDVFLLNPDFLPEEMEALSLLASRLPSRYLTVPGTEEVREALASGLGQERISALGLKKELDYSRLKETFGKPKGLVYAPADSRQDCLMAASWAVRLGYGFLPFTSGENLARLLEETTAEGEFPILPAAPPPQGQEEAYPSAPPQGAPFPLHLVFSGGGTWQTKNPLFSRAVFLTDSAGILDLTKGFQKDYLLLVNSTDIIGPQGPGVSLGEMKVTGLSLLAPLMASFRHLFLFDAAAPEPKPLEIEEQLNKWVREKGLVPKFRAILASPGYLPFIVGKNCAIGSMTEEMVREIHLRLNDDLFFDVAEGRLFQSTPGGLSLQLLSTKYYSELKKPEGKTLVVTTPQVEKGIIFATDDALIQSQLLPLLEETGQEVTLLTGRESNAEGMAAALQESTFFLYTGHGGPETLNTHGHYMSRQDLSSLPPLVAYASACSTTYMRPHLSSPNDGLSWDEIPIRGRDIIGLALVEKGALCFVGGATTMDLQYSTSIYGIFMESLLVKGRSVGEALLDTQNFISLYSQVLLQKAPKAWRNYTYGTANALHQQILFGDPALIPCPGEKDAALLPREIQEIPQGYRIQVTIPASRWRRAKAPVHPGKPTSGYYKSREMEVISPYGTGVISWGDFYPIAPDAEGISDTSLMSSFLHLSLDLPPGMVPASLRLAEAAAAEPECLICGRETPDSKEAVERFSDFRLPFLMQPPLRLDLRGGWPYALEEKEGGLCLHWLTPLLVIDDKARTAHRAESLTFTLEVAAGAGIYGRIKTAGFKSPGPLVVTAGRPLKTPAKCDNSRNKEGEEKPPEIYALAQSLTRRDGSFRLFCSGEAEVLTVDREYPLYQLPFDSSPIPLGSWRPNFTQPVNITPAEEDYLRLQGKVVDSMTAKPVQGALLRAWRGKFDSSGDPLLDSFAGEVTTGSDGSYMFLLTPGDYILYAAARAGKTLYKSTFLVINLEEKCPRHQILTLDQAAILRGSITFTGEPLPFPATIKVRRFPEKESIETLAMVSLRRDGTFECIVSFQDRFSIVVEEEGRPPVRDTNQGQGYKLLPGEVLERSYTL